MCASRREKGQKDANYSVGWKTCANVDMLLSLLSLLFISNLVFGCDFDSNPSEKVHQAQIAVKGLVTDLFPADTDGSTAEVWLQDTYKGAEKLASSLGINDNFYVRDK